MFILPKERGDVRTPLIVFVRYQTGRGVRILLAFMVPNLITKEKKKLLRLTNKLILAFGDVRHLTDCVPLDHVACRASLDHLRWLSRDLTLVKENTVHQVPPSPKAKIS